jgi:NAD(P) transhydrogenase
VNTSYDLVVIGSGPAGEKGAAKAAYFGKRVALVEKGRLGGASRNTGTLPSKTLRESALIISGLHQRDIPGLHVARRSENLSVRDFMAHKDRVVADEGERIRLNLERHKVDVFEGTASLAGPNAVRVVRPGAPEIVLQAKVILIATGTTPHRPPEIPFADTEVDDSDEVLDVPEIPKTLIVVGGGVIGSEYACIYAALGITQVTLVERTDRILSFVDRELTAGLTEAMRRLGIEVLTEERVTTFGKRADGTGVKVTLSSGRELEADRLLATAGRSGNTRGMGLEDAGVKCNNRGHVMVNASFQSSVPSVYAAGDVVGFPGLSSTSMEQGRLAVTHAFGLGGQTKVAELFPYGIYTIPEMSMVGLSEQEAIAKHPDDVVCGRARYRDNARGNIANDKDGFLKLVVRRSDRTILGVHIIGERATELIHTAQAVMALGGTVQYFVDYVFNYPTLSEVYKYAAYDALGRIEKAEHPAHDQAL